MKIPKTWDERVRRIATMTEITKKETVTEKNKRLALLKEDYNAFVQYYFPSEVDCDCADYHIEMAHKIRDNKKINLLNIIYRGGAKSTHVNMMIPIWLIFFYKDLDFMVLVGYSQDLAMNLLRAIQVQFENNQRLISDFGSQIQAGDWSEGEFTIRAGASFKAIGMKQPFRGLKDMYNRRPGYISVDDVDDRDDAANQELTHRRVSRLLGALKGSFQKETQRFVFSNNLIHKQGITSHLIDKLKTSKRTRIIWRNAVISKPKKETLLHQLINLKGLSMSYKGESQKHGDPSWHQRYTADYWEEVRNDTPSSEYAREFENDPVEEGKIFKASWIQYKVMPPLSEYSQILGYGDLSYRKTGDYKALAILGRWKNEFHVLKVFFLKSSLNAVIDFCYDWHEQCPESVATSYWVEANFIQDTFLDAFNEAGDNRGFYLSVRGDKRVKPDKFIRIETMTAPFESGKIFFNQAEKSNPHMIRFVDNILQFEKGVAHDDGPDALEGGYWLLNKNNKRSKFAAKTVSFIKNLTRSF